MPGVTRTESDLNAAFRKMITDAASRVRYCATRRLYQRFLLSQGRFIATTPSDRFFPLRQRYQQYLRQLRDLAPATLQAHDGTVTDFLSRVLSARRGLRALRQADVEHYVQLRSRDSTRRTLQNIVTRLRAFLRYCHDCGEVPARLDAIDLPRVFRGELPPRALDWPTVRALLRSIDRRSWGGWRDYTILHLMAYYGLRPSEVISLRFDSIDWTACTLQVHQCKTRSTLTLPLAHQTIAVLRQYLARRAAPESRQSPELFLRLPSPHVLLRQSAITQIFDKRVRQSNLPIPGHSAYSLRHSFAMRLLNRGVGVKAIGDVMGHRDLHSTCMYLRLDTRTLRDVALPVPGARRLSGGLRV
jgi:integrase/recombinase XerD